MYDVFSLTYVLCFRRGMLALYMSNIVSVVCNKDFIIGKIVPF